MIAEKGDSMKIDAHKFGLVGGVASSILYIGCSILMQFWPAKTIEMSAALFHLSSYGPLIPYFDLSPQIFVSGLVQSFVYSYIYFYILGYLFHRIHK
jgi:hypothetical protein